MKRMQEKIIEHNSANFTGSVKLEEVEIDILGFKNLRCLKVSFEEGARTYWHKHPSGQILVILSASPSMYDDVSQGLPRESWSNPAQTISIPICNKFSTFAIVSSACIN